MTIDPSHFQEAVALFNQGKFFECHEVLEDLWHPLPPSSEKTFLQGLLQVGVGFHHWRNGNFTGAKNLLTAGCDKLTVALQDNTFQAPFPLAPLLTVFRDCLQQASAGYPPSNTFPKIQWVASS